MTGINGLLERHLNLLVAWFAVFQVGHLIALAWFLLDPRDTLKFLEPPGGWVDQSVEVLIGWSLTDGTLAILSLLAVTCWFSGTKRAPKWVLVTVNLSFYSAILFLVINLRLGTFANTPALSALAFLGYLPINFLAYILFIRADAGDIPDD